MDAYVTRFTTIIQFEGNSILGKGGLGKAYCMQYWLQKYALHWEIFCMLIYGFLKVGKQETENSHRYFGEQSSDICIVTGTALLVSLNGNLILRTVCCTWYVCKQKGHIEGKNSSIHL